LQYMKGKISTHQAILLSLTVIMSPSVRFIPNFTATKAKQAAWVSPAFSFLIIFLFLYVVYAIVDKYQDTPFSEVMNDICGVVIGKILLSLYIIWLTVLTTFYVRYYAERLLTTVMPYINNYLFTVIMLISVAIMVRKSIVALVRMNELMLPIFVLVFVGCFVFSIFKIQVKNFLPVSRLDVIPISKAGIGIVGMWGYLPFIFLFSGMIHSKKDIKKYGLKSVLFLTSVTVPLIAMCIGMLGPKIIETMPIPFFVAVKQISLFDTIERIESIVVTIWIFSDLLLISLFISMLLEMFKSLFRLSDTCSLTGIYCIFLFFLSFYLARDIFELECFSSQIYIYVNVIFLIILPTLVFFVGKLRKKV